MRECLPKDVEDILEYLRSRIDESGCLPRDEIDKVQADMANVPGRWTLITWLTFYRRCLGAGTTESEASELVGTLQSVQRGAVEPPDTHRGFRFAAEPRRDLIEEVEIGPNTYTWLGPLGIFTPVSVNGSSRTLSFGSMDKQSNGWLLRSFLEAGVELGTRDT